MEFLKDVLGDEYEKFSSCLNDYNETHKDNPVKVVNLSSGNYVSKAKYDALNLKLETAQSVMSELETKIQGEKEAENETIKSLQAELNAYKEAREKEASEKALNIRFEAAKGNKQFINNFTENGIKSAFSDALRSPNNASMSDSEIFMSIVKDRADIFANEHNPPDIKGMGKNIDAAIDKSEFEKLTLSDQMKFANDHKEEYEKLYRS